MMTANSLSELQFKNFANWSNHDSLVAYLIACYHLSADLHMPIAFVSTSATQGLSASPSGCEHWNDRLWFGDFI